jgi:hypothetical protein
MTGINVFEENSNSGGFFLNKFSYDAVYELFGEQKNGGEEELFR